MNKEVPQIIGQNEFGLTEANIQEAIKSTKQYISVLPDPPVSDLDAYDLERQRKYLAHLTQEEPQKIIENVQQIFALVKKLENENPNQQEIIHETLKKYPDLTSYSSLLRQINWGKELIFQTNLFITTWENWYYNLKHMK